MISIRFEMPAFSAGSWRTSLPESVTAVLNFLRIVSGGSTSRTTPCGAPRVVDINRSGSCRFLIRAPSSGIETSGTTNVCPKRWLNRSAMSRVSSTCCRWSSPTGTRSVRIEPGGEQQRREVERRLTQLPGLERRRDRVQVDDAEERLALFLRGCVLARLQEAGVDARVTRGREATVIGAIGERELLATLPLEGYPGVEQVVPILKPYKLVAREVAPDPTVIDVNGRKIGDEYFGLIAGPCTVEYREQTLETARAVAAAGATMLRGGAFKPRTSPYTFQGLGDDALTILQEAREETGLPVVTELMDPRHVEAVLEAADVIQIGARNMQNFLLLAEVGRADKPVLLKRGPSASVEELLMAAEYVAKEGNDRIVLCERGIKTFETTTRYTLDLGSVAVLKNETHLPVIVDPSHAAGKRELVLPLARAAVAVGADGIIVESHPRPEEALCDGPQQIPTAEFADFAREIAAVAALVGKQIG